MSEYPLKVRLHKADFVQVNPNSKVASYTVSARYGNESEKKFVVIDPMNGNELEVYGSVETAVENGESHFYWVEKVLTE